MAITINTHHNNCEVKAIKGPFGIHYGKLICSNHNKHIQWLNEQDFETVIGILGKFNNKDNWQFRIKNNGEIAVRPPKHLPKKSGVKQRPSRQKPKTREITTQRKYGNIWQNTYTETI